MASSSISLRASKSSTKSFPQNEYGYNTDMAITDDDALEYKLFSKATSEKQQGEMGLGIPERRMLQAGKKQHRETTDSARRSLQVRWHCTFCIRIQRQNISKMVEMLAMNNHFVYISGGRANHRNGKLNPRGSAATRASSSKSRIWDRINGKKCC